MALVPVNALSDDESLEVKKPMDLALIPPAFLPRKRPRVGFRKKKVSTMAHLNLTALQNHLKGRCGCTLDCFEPFRQPQLNANWVSLRKTFFKLTMLEKDNWAINSETPFIATL